MKDIPRGYRVQDEAGSGSKKYWQELDRGQGPHDEVTYKTWRTDTVRCLKRRKGWRRKRETMRGGSISYVRLDGVGKRGVREESSGLNC